MNELELIVNDTKCSIEDAVNYLSARTMFYRAVVNEQEKLKEYLSSYMNASNKIYPPILKISQEGVEINHSPIRVKDKE